MHVCLICVEIFAWGKYGGFGRATRLIGRELVKRGIEVTAIVPRRSNQAKVEMLDGIRVLGFDLNDVPGMLKIYRDCDADIYHSQEPSFGTFLAERLHPEKKHLLTFRDTRLFSDWLTEIRLPSLNKMQVLMNWAYEDGFLVHHAARSADRCFASANFLKDRAMKKYKLKDLPGFLPTPVVIPAKIEKDATPTVCYIARWDRRKRPELMLEIARLHPNVHFIMAGLSRDPHYDHEIRSRFSELPNVELTGFINQFESDRLSNILSRSWVLINTASREGLPNSFLEACAHRCAILSSVDPDEFSSNFGYYAQDQHLSTGLDYLLENNRWKELGEKGFEYVSQTFALETAMQQHLAIYEVSRA